MVGSSCGRVRLTCGCGFVGLQVWPWMLHAGRRHGDAPCSRHVCFCRESRCSALHDEPHPRASAASSNYWRRRSTRAAHHKRITRHGACCPYLGDEHVSRWQGERASTVCGAKCAKLLAHLFVSLQGWKCVPPCSPAEIVLETDEWLQGSSHCHMALSAEVFARDGTPEPMEYFVQVCSVAAALRVCCSGSW